MGRFSFIFGLALGAALVSVAVAEPPARIDVESFDGAQPEPADDAVEFGDRPARRPLIDRAAGTRRGRTLEIESNDQPPGGALPASARRADQPTDRKTGSRSPSDAASSKRSPKRLAQGEPELGAGLSSPSAGAEPNGLPPNPNDAKPGAPEAKKADDLDSLLDLAEKDAGALNSVKVGAGGSASNAAPTSQFDSEQLNEAKSSNTTGELLENAPSVFLRRTSAINLDARVRGFSGSQVVAAADGATQIKTRLDIDSVFSQIDPNLVTSLSLIEGPYAVEYGPGFAFLTAELTQPGRSEALETHSATQFGFNTNGRQLMWRQGGRVTDKNWGGLVSVGQRLGNDYRAGSNDHLTNIPSSYHVDDAFAALSGDVHDGARLDVSVLHQDLRDVELPGVTYDVNRQASDQINLRLALRDEPDGPDRMRLQFWWTETTYDGDSTRSSKQATFVNRLLGEMNPELLNGTVVGRGLSNSWGARNTLLFGDPDSPVTWKLGGDWQRTRQFYHEQDYQADGTVAYDGDVFGLPDAASDDFGVFLTGTWKPFTKVTLTAGHRVDWVSYSVNEDDIAIQTAQVTPQGHNDALTAGPTYVLNSTFLTGQYALTDHWTLSAGAAHAMRPPNLAELYSDQPFVPLVRFGNSFSFGDSTLSPERNLQFDLGLTGKYKRGTIGGRAYHAMVWDYVGLTPTNYSNFPQIGVAPPGSLGRGRPYLPDPTVPNQDLSTDTGSIGYLYRNLALATLWGGELFGDYELAPWLVVTGAGAYTQGTNYDPKAYDVYTGQLTSLGRSDPLPGIVPLNSTFGLRLIEPRDKRAWIELQARVVNQQDRVAYTLSEVGTAGYTVFNLHGQWKATDQLTFHSSILNLLDKDYTQHGSLAIVNSQGGISFVKEPGFSWFSSVAYEF